MSPFDTPSRRASFTPEKQTQLLYIARARQLADEGADSGLMQCSHELLEPNAWALSPATGWWRLLSGVGSLLAEVETFRAEQPRIIDLIFTLSD